MSDDMSKPIIIWNVSEGGIGDDLLGCYFIKHGNKYDFYDKDGNEKVPNIEIGSQFSFKLDEHPHIEWLLTLNTGSNTEASGNYRDQVLGAKRPEPEPVYQAQAQGGKEEEDSAASATA